jgi:hypothetical protein
LTTLLLPRESDSLPSEKILELLDATAAGPGWIPLHEPRELDACLIKLQPAKEISGSAVRQGETIPCKFPAACSRDRLCADGFSHAIPVGADNAELFNKAVKSACESVIAAEPEITRYDTSESTPILQSDQDWPLLMTRVRFRLVAGDGDCGTCLQAGAEGQW